MGKASIYAPDHEFRSIVTDYPILRTAPGTNAGSMAKMLLFGNFRKTNVKW